MNDPRTSYRHRLVTAFFHLLLGSALVICGIIVVIMHFPGEDLGTPVRYGRDKGNRLDRMDSQFWGTWMGLILVFTSIFGFLSKSSQRLIFLFMVSNVLTSFAAIIGVIVGGLYVGGTTNFIDTLENRYNKVPKYPQYYYPCFVPSSVAGSFQVVSVDNMTQQLYDECIRLHIEAAAAHLPYYCIMLACFVLEFFNALFAILFSCVGLGRCSSSGRSAAAVRNQRLAQRQAFSDSRLQHIQRHTEFYLQSMASRPVTTLPSSPDRVTELPSHDPPPLYSSLSFPQPSSYGRVFSPPMTFSPHNHQNGGQSNQGAELTDTELPSYELAVSLTLGVESIII